MTEKHFPQLLPFTSLGRASEDDLRGQRRLMALLQQATGIPDLQPGWRGIGAAVMLDAAIGTKSTQRISLQGQDEGLTLCTWPAELKPQAEALYQTGRAERLVDFVAERPRKWLARPNVHLAFWNASVTQRLYLHCHLPITEYVHAWSGRDFEQIRVHRHGDIRDNLWPWLRERQYASPEDDQHLDAFLKCLGRRDAHLRPGIEVRRVWSWPQAVNLDERGALASEIRTAVAGLLTALDEPLPPACTAAPLSSRSAVDVADTVRTNAVPERIRIRRGRHHQMTLEPPGRTTWRLVLSNSQGPGQAHIQEPPPATGRHGTGHPS